ncbi:uncharacterized protein LOC120558905 [Perca fluviatilis]|uniref:uncharacterized protein LOC120558905 n=1 Tax=Perca fluviatilis TaxID=8168 RepID=UPI001962CA58|nr:uncharacterized protein LOC120558905 [Perca fluviatilis]
MEELRSQSFRMNSLQDESSGTKTSSEKDDSDSMCPDSGLRTQDCMSVKCSRVMGGALVDVGLMSLESIRLTCPQTIEAAEGDDVIIQCGLDPPVDLSDYTLDVARLDLGDDDGDVYCYRRGKYQQDDQMDRYRDRTTLNHEDLIRGIVTLTISSVTLSDSGKYKVYIPDLRHSFIINITVGSAKEESVWIIVLSSVCVGGAVGVLLLLVKRGIIWKKRKESETRSDNLIV